jgi:hypothetical protein
VIDLDLTPYITRLRDRVSAFREVAGAASLEKAMTGHAVPPSAYLVLAGDDAQPERTRAVGAHQQLVTARFDVFVCERNVADAFGGEAAADLRPLRTAALAALTGYTPAPADLSPLDRTQSRLWHLNDGVIWWRLGFATEFLAIHDPESP